MTDPTQQRCPWCHTLNDITAAHLHQMAVFCDHCGHRADVEREADCQGCEARRRILAQREQ